MFKQTYKTTLKNILRSKTFWLSLILMLGITVYDALDFKYGYYDLQLREMIRDTDPRFVLEYKVAVQAVSNTCSMFLNYIFPLFAVVTTYLVLNRDYKDRYFEIEKAGGVRTATYLGGRLAALITVNFLLATLVVMLSYYIYVFTRGGVGGMETADMLADTIVRLLRTSAVRVWTCMLFYICFTYAVGSLFKTGIIGAVVGMGYVVINFAAYLVLRLRIDNTYFEYFMPAPRMLSHYFHFYDSEWFEGALSTYSVEQKDPWICLAIVLGAAALYYIISCLRIHKREI